MRFSQKMGWILAAVVIVLSASVVLQLLRRQDRLVKQQQLKADSLQIQVNRLAFKYGEALFRMHCSSCHSIELKTDNILLGIVDRLGEKYLRLYLTRQDSLIQARDKYAVQIKAAFHNTPNSHNIKFTREELDAIITYLK